MSTKKLERILLFGDAHRPYHDKRAWSLFLKAGRAFRPKHLISLGDLADFYSVSSHSKDPRRANRLEAEIADVQLALDELSALGAANKLFVAGNHEDRLRRYLQDKAPELFGLIDIPQLFRLRERGWAYVPYKAHGRLGKLHLTHDVGNSGRNATFVALDTYQHSVVTGHSHRLQYIVEGNAVGEFKLSAQFGWLGDMAKIEYMYQAKAAKNWALGFGVGYLDPATGIAYLTPIPIVKYTCVVEGRLYRA